MSVREKRGKVKSYWSGFFRAMIVAALVLTQFVAIFALAFWLAGYTVYIYLLMEITSILIMLGLVNDNRSPSYKLSWICVVLALPLTGHIMYLLWGRTGKRKLERQVLYKMQHGQSFYEYDEEVMKQFEGLHPQETRLAHSMEQHRFPLFANNAVTYYPMGENTFEAIFEAMQKAERFIFINFYIVGEGVLWDQMFKIMKERAKAGVEIKFLYDDFGCMFRTEKGFKRKLEKEGIEVRIFNPVHRYTEKLYMNYRNHQKIVVVDGNVAFTGGMNIADEYVNEVERFGVWKDNAVRVEGDAAWGFTVSFLQMWEVSSNGALLDYDKYKPNRVFVKSDVFCQVITDGPANNPENPIVSAYKQVMYCAKNYLYITTPYLIIDDEIKEALKLAVKGGVDVRLITPNIPDKKNVKLVTSYNYGELLRAGVRIYEYTPGFIHAKTILTEDCGIIGTINMDYRSFYLHYECGALIYNKEALQPAYKDLLDTMKISHEITYEEWKHRPLWIKVKQNFLNLFATLM